MMRLLFIARYRDDTMRCKVQYLAQIAEIELHAIEPAQWRDELLHPPARGMVSYARRALPMWGEVNDPHRAFYRTLTFDLPRFQPHLIHAEEEPDSLAAAHIALARALFAPRAKLVLHTWQNIYRRRHPTVEAVLTYSLRAANAVLCANHDAQAILRQQGYHKPTPLIPAVGVDTSVFRPSEKRPHVGFVLGYFGRLVPEKDLTTLLTALTHLPEEVHLRIVGHGPQKTELQTHVAQLQLSQRVTFLAPRPPAELVAEYAQLDAFVLPSRTTPVWKEQLGRVLLEAMACRVPVIGSDSGAIPEVIAAAGLVFPEGQAEALAACVQALMDSAALRATLAEQGYQRAHTVYAQDQLAARTAAFYHQLLRS